MNIYICSDALFKKSALCRRKLNSNKSGKKKNPCVCVHMRTHTSVRDLCTLHHTEQLAMPLFEIFIMNIMKELCGPKPLSHISEAIFIAVWQSLLSAHEYVTSPPDFRLILTEIVNNYIIGITFLRAFNSVETFVLFSFSSPLPMTVFLWAAFGSLLSFNWCCVADASLPLSGHS